MSTEDALSGIGLGSNEGETVVGLTDHQKAEVREIFTSAIKAYWNDDAIKRLASDRAESRVNDLLEHSITAKVAALIEHNPQAVMDQLFRQPGMVVKTDASKYFDGTIGAMLQDEASGIPEAIRQHVRENLPTLIQNAISGIVAAMVVNYISGNADALAEASRTMISQAFQNATVRAY